MAHPPLSEHLHPTCVAEIAALKKCHAERSIAKFFGVCTELHKQLDACFQREFDEVRKRNHQKAIEFQRKHEADMQRWREAEQRRKEQQQHQQQQKQQQ